MFLSTVLSLKSDLTLSVYEVAEQNWLLHINTFAQSVSWDVIVWPTHLLAAFGGCLLAALSVAGVPAHWINTARETKQVISIIHRETVSPHYSAKTSGRDKKLL